MAARTRICEFEGVSQGGDTNSFVFTIPGPIAAGSLVRFGFRHEDGAQVTLTITDDAGASGYTVRSLSTQENPSVYVCYKHNHPGSAGDIEVTVSLSDTKSYREAWGEVVSGQVGELDPRTGTDSTDTDVSSGPMSCTVTGVSGDCDVFMICGSYSGSNNYAGDSGSSRIPTTIGAYTLYAAAFVQHYTGSGDKTITAAGGNGATRAYAVAFLDDAGTGGGSGGGPLTRGLTQSTLTRSRLTA